MSTGVRETGQPLRVAVLGCGSVGSQVVRLLQEQAGDLAARVGARVELVGVAVRRLDAPREVDVPADLLTTDAAGLVRGDVDLVVEVIGGIEPARSLILAALENGASVKPAPEVSILSRMKLVVPLTMPSTRVTRSPASDSRSGRRIGIAPATDAS